MHTQYRLKDRYIAFGKPGDTIYVRTYVLLHIQKSHRLQATYSTLTEVLGYHAWHTEQALDSVNVAVDAQLHLIDVTEGVEEFGHATRAGGRSGGGAVRYRVAHTGII